MPDLPADGQVTSTTAQQGATGGTEPGTSPPASDLPAGRQVTQGTRSLKGRQWNERTRLLRSGQIWTVLGTCREQGRSAWRFLQDALLAFHGHGPAPSFIPHATYGTEGLRLARLQGLPAPMPALRLMTCAQGYYGTAVAPNRTPRMQGVTHGRAPRADATKRVPPRPGPPAGTPPVAFGLVAWPGDDGR